MSGAQSISTRRARSQGAYRSNSAATAEEQSGGVNRFAVLRFATALRVTPPARCGSEGA